MLSLAIIIVAGVLAREVFSKANIPGLLGMILLGMLLGPGGLNFLDDRIMGLADALRTVALIIILIRAGLGLRIPTLKQVGSPAIRLSFLPGLMEGFTIMAIAPLFFGLSLVESGMLGFIIASVSPAVIVPFMLAFQKKRIGTNKRIPTLILAGSSLDDVLMITAFSVFLGLFTGTNMNIAWSIAGIPLSVLFGAGLGLLAGAALIFLFKRRKVRDTQKVMIILAAAFGLYAIEDFARGVFPVASLLGIIVIGFFIVEKDHANGEALSDKYERLWVLAEVFLFILIGAQVNVGLALEVGLAGLALVSIGLVARSIGVFLSVARTPFSFKERLFCVFAFMPKATVQAAIGAVPLAVGAPGGELILALSVLAVLITAPVGAIGIQVLGKRLLHVEPPGTSGPTGATREQVDGHEDTSDVPAGGSTRA